MQIEVKGRNTSVTSDLRDHVQRRFAKVARQVSELARLDVELSQERNPAIAERCVAEATLHLKGTSLRARDVSRDMTHAINLISDELARQVKRDREKRRGRRQARAQEASEGTTPAG